LFSGTRKNNISPLKVTLVLVAGLVGNSDEGKERKYENEVEGKRSKMIRSRYCDVEKHTCCWQRSAWGRDSQPVYLFTALLLSFSRQLMFTFCCWQQCENGAITLNAIFHQF